MPRSRSSRARRQRMTTPSLSSQPRLPMITTNAVNSTTMRFTRSNASTSAETIDVINDGSLINCVGLLAISANTAYQIAQAYKVNSVSIWGITNASVVTTCPSVAIRWYSQMTASADAPSSTRVVQDSSLSTAFPARVATRPQSHEIGSFWRTCNNASDVVFEVILGPSTACVIDVHISWVMSDQTNSFSSINTATTMTTGQVYYPPLDGVSSHAFTRVGLPSIF